MATACSGAELGIDLQGILRRSIAVLTHRLGSNVLLDLDLGGPLFFAAILGSVHLLVGALSCSDTTLPPGTPVPPAFNYSCRAPFVEAALCVHAAVCCLCHK